MNAFERMNTALMVDEAKQIFKVSRQAFVDPDILAAERSRIFDKCWLYLGHSSEVPKPGDFVTRRSAVATSCSHVMPRDRCARC